MRHGRQQIYHLEQVSTKLLTSVVRASISERAAAALAEADFWYSRKPAPPTKFNHIFALSGESQAWGS